MNDLNSELDLKQWELKTKKIDNIEVVSNKDDT